MPSEWIDRICERHGFLARVPSTAGVYCGRCKGWIRYAEKPVSKRKRPKKGPIKNERKGAQ